MHATVKLPSKRTPINKISITVIQYMYLVIHVNTSTPEIPSTDMLDRSTIRINRGSKLI